MNDENAHIAVDAVVRSESGLSFRRVLDPVDRAAEILFGLIIVMTFTGSLGVAQAGSADVKAMLLGALSCNLAWGVLLGSTAERRLAKQTVEAVQMAPSASLARSVIASALPPLVLPALSATDLDRIRHHLMNLPAKTIQVRIEAHDFAGAIAVFLVVFSLTFPIVAPFLFINDATIALRFSNGIAVGLLFATGYTFGRHAVAPLRVGLLIPSWA